MLELRKLRVREVNLGHRKIGSELTNEYLEKLLENGRNLRKSNAYPIKCEVKLNRIWKDSKHNIETTRQRREQRAQKGTLPPSVPIEPSHYIHHWNPYPAIIPDGGITKQGYVREVWIQSHISKSVEIDNQSYDLIDPYVHDTEQWIQGFILDSDGLVKLLPSQRIVVKYFHRSK